MPYNGKIADINESDTNVHYLTGLSALLGDTRKIVAVFVRADRASGTGNLQSYPNDGTITGNIYSTALVGLYFLADGTDRLKYAQNVANDDFDLYCLGYVVEVP